jgi:hypothetical protein
MALPDEFWHANDFGVRGGVENAFMSTTLDRNVAMGYASGDKATMGIVIEAQQGQVNRGADMSWLSQYPHERECAAHMHIRICMATCKRPDQPTQRVTGSSLAR